MKVLYFLLLYIFVTGAVFAQSGNLPREDVVETPAILKDLCVSNVFQANMVLQRDKPVAIWGWADPGEKVIVNFAGQAKSVTAGTDRSWRVTLDAMSVNTEPQTLIVKGKSKTIQLDNILIGDVWVLGGQSNMEFPITRVENGNLEAISANFPQIRILSMPLKAGLKKRKSIERLQEWNGWFKTHYKKGYWEECTPKTVRELSAIGYVFARRIHKASRVPIGVIDTSAGGTTVETWTPLDVLRKLDGKEVKEKLADWDKKVAEWDSKKDLATRVEKHKSWLEKMKKQGKPIPEDKKVLPTDLRSGPVADKNHPGSLYASIIGPLEGLSVKGAIFHQGYNNAFEGTFGGKMYTDIFPQLIKSWRAAFNDENLAFGILSLCTGGNPQTLDNYCEFMFDGGVFIREAQYKTFLDFYKAGDKNIGFVSTFDLRRRWYHPQLKVPAGERVARWALASQYGFANEVEWLPPVITEMKVEKGSITLKFNRGLGNPLDGNVEGFAVAGEDRKFHPAKAEFYKGPGMRRPDNKVLVLTSIMIEKPIHYRYAWSRNPMGNLVATQGRQPPFTDVPLATQRSDDWPMEDVPKGVLGGEVTKTLSRGQRYRVLDTLKLQDLQRKMKEAELYLKTKKSEISKLESKLK